MAKKPIRSEGFTAAQAAAAQRLQENPNTPQVILKAIFPEAGQETFHIRPLSLLSFMALEQIGNPLAVIGSNSEVSSADIAKALVIMGMPYETDEHIEAIRNIVGSPKTLDSAAWHLAARIPAESLQAIGEEIRERIARAFATAIPTKSPGDKSTPLAVSQPGDHPSAGL